MSRKKVSVRVMKEVVDELGEVFTTKDVSEDTRMKNAHPNLLKHSHYHAFVGGALSDHRAELDIEEIQKRTSRGSRWQKTSLFLIGSRGKNQNFFQNSSNFMLDKADKPVTLVCPSCGGKLKVSQDLDSFICAHCGNEHIIQHSGGTVLIRPVIEQIEAMRDDVVSVKRRIEINNAELAIQRINHELSLLRSDLRALKEKSKNELTLPGMIGCFGVLFILFGIIAIFLGAIDIFALLFIIGIILFVICVIWPSQKQKKIEQLKERIESLEKKNKEYFQIINRGL